MIPEQWQRILDAAEKYREETKGSGGGVRGSLSVRWDRDGKMLEQCMEIKLLESNEK